MFRLWSDRDNIVTVAPLPALAIPPAMIDAVGKDKNVYREGGHEPSARRLSRPLWPRDGLSVEPPVQHARASRGAPDLSCRRNAGPDRRERRTMAARRRFHRRDQPVGTA